MALAKGAIGRLKVPQPEASAKAWCFTLPGSCFIWLVVCYEVTKHNMYVCTYVRMYVCTYVRTYVRRYVCMYVRTYVCTYVCT